MIMKTNRTLASWIAQCGLLWGASTLTASDVEDRLAQSYQVKPGGRLAVEADRGSIEVKSAEGTKSPSKCCGKSEAKAVVERKKC